MDEFSLISKYFAPLTEKVKEANKLKDDAAFIHSHPGYRLAVSQDLAVENVHFYRQDGGYNIAYKLLAANLSDMAACGAKPLYYLLGFSKNHQNDEKFIADFCRALKELGNKHQIALIGGDTVSTAQELFFSITIFGEVKIGQEMPREGAKEGDLIFVCGYIGDAFLGLKILQSKIGLISSSLIYNKREEKYLLSRHFYPQPRLELGMELAAKKLANAAIDVSDGLLADLTHICQASGLKAIVAEPKIPISAAANSFLKKNPQFKRLDLFSGGDDYEIIFTAGEKKKNKIIELAKKLNLPLTIIGKMTKTTRAKHNSEPINLINDAGELIKISKYGYQH